MSEEQQKKLLSRIREGTEVDYIASHAHEMSNDELKDIAVEALCAAYDLLGKADYMAKFLPQLAQELADLWEVPGND